MIAEFLNGWSVTLFTALVDIRIIHRVGEMAEWSKAPVLKTGKGL
ncbi:hypothetical protein P3TCK_04651 [Photobacterium profundum 3TCK]|uniref:Uncharacterized protein n=1 Tax=Photobacterium profundum 3TCK TaxID=314280 RepID=Q1ZA55_9GAMM|nr:hypothetical protein P3TCK_04651 [Photobacterium profundum 3TCK]